MHKMPSLTSNPTWLCMLSAAPMHEKLQIRALPLRTLHWTWNQPRQWKMSLIERLGCRLGAAASYSFLSFPPLTFRFFLPSTFQAFMLTIPFADNERIFPTLCWKLRRLCWSRLQQRGRGWKQRSDFLRGS